MATRPRGPHEDVKKRGFPSVNDIQAPILGRHHGDTPGSRTQNQRKHPPPKRAGSTDSQHGDPQRRSRDNGHHDENEPPRQQFVKQMKMEPQSPPAPPEQVRDGRGNFEDPAYHAPPRAHRAPSVQPERHCDSGEEGKHPRIPHQRRGSEAGQPSRPDSRRHYHRSQNSGECLEAQNRVMRNDSYGIQQRREVDFEQRQKAAMDAEREYIRKLKELEVEREEMRRSRQKESDALKREKQKLEEERARVARERLEIEEEHDSLRAQQQEIARLTGEHEAITGAYRNKRKKLEEREGVLDKKERELTRMVAEIKKKEELIAQYMPKVKDTEQNIKEARRLFREAETLGQKADHDMDIAKRDMQLAKQRQDEAGRQFDLLEERSRDLLAREARLGERESELDGLEEEFNGFVARKIDEFNAQMEEIENTKAELEEQSQELVKLKTSLTRAQDDWAAERLKYDENCQTRAEEIVANAEATAQEVIEAAHHDAAAIMEEAEQYLVLSKEKAAEIIGSAEQEKEAILDHYKESLDMETEEIRTEIRKEAEDMAKSVMDKKRRELEAQMDEEKRTLIREKARLETELEMFNEQRRELEDAFKIQDEKEANLRAMEENIAALQARAQEDALAAETRRAELRKEEEVLRKKWDAEEERLKIRSHDVEERADSVQRRFETAKRLEDSREKIVQFQWERLATVASRIAEREQALSHTSPSWRESVKVMDRWEQDFNRLYQASKQNDTGALEALMKEMSVTEFLADCQKRRKEAGQPEFGLFWARNPLEAPGATGGAPITMSGARSRTGSQMGARVPSRGHFENLMEAKRPPTVGMRQSTPKIRPQDGRMAEKKSSDLFKSFEPSKNCRDTIQRISKGMSARPPPEQKEEVVTIEDEDEGRHVIDHRHTGSDRSSQGKNSHSEGYRGSGGFQNDQGGGSGTQDSHQRVHGDVSQSFTGDQQSYYGAPSYQGGEGECDSSIEQESQPKYGDNEGYFGENGERFNEAREACVDESSSQIQSAGEPHPGYEAPPPRSNQTTSFRNEGFYAGGSGQFTHVDTQHDRSHGNVSAYSIGAEPVNPASGNPEYNYGAEYGDSRPISPDGERINTIQGECGEACEDVLPAQQVIRHSFPSGVRGFRGPVPGPLNKNLPPRPPAPPAPPLMVIGGSVRPIAPTCPTDPVGSSTFPTQAASDPKTPPRAKRVPRVARSPLEPLQAPRNTLGQDYAKLAQAHRLATLQTETTQAPPSGAPLTRSNAPSQEPPSESSVGGRLSEEVLQQSEDFRRTVSEYPCTDSGASSESGFELLIPASRSAPANATIAVKSLAQPTQQCPEPQQLETKSRPPSASQSSLPQFSQPAVNPQRLSQVPTEDAAQPSAESNLSTPPESPFDSPQRADGPNAPPRETVVFRHAHLATKPAACERPVDPPTFQVNPAPFPERARPQKPPARTHSPERPPPDCSQLFKDGKIKWLSKTRQSEAIHKHTNREPPPITAVYNAQGRRVYYQSRILKPDEAKVPEMWTKLEAEARAGESLPPFAARPPVSQDPRWVDIPTISSPMNSEHDEFYIEDVNESYNEALKTNQTNTLERTITDPHIVPTNSIRDYLEWQEPISRKWSLNSVLVRRAARPEATWRNCNREFLPQGPNDEVVFAMADRQPYHSNVALTDTRLMDAFRYTKPLPTITSNERGYFRRVRARTHEIWIDVSKRDVGPPRRNATLEIAKNCKDALTRVPFVKPLQLVYENADFMDVWLHKRHVRDPPRGILLPEDSGFYIPEPLCYPLKDRIRWQYQFCYSDEDMKLEWNKFNCEDRMWTVYAEMGKQDFDVLDHCAPTPENIAPCIIILADYKYVKDESYRVLPERPDYKQGGWFGGGLAPARFLAKCIGSLETDNWCKMVLLNLRQGELLWQKFSDLAIEREKMLENKTEEEIEAIKKTAKYTTLELRLKKVPPVVYYDFMLSHCCSHRFLESVDNVKIGRILTIRLRHTEILLLCGIAVALRTLLYHIRTLDDRLDLHNLPSLETFSFISGRRGLNEKAFKGASEWNAERVRWKRILERHFAPIVDMNVADLEHASGAYTVTVKGGKGGSLFQKETDARYMSQIIGLKPLEEYPAFEVFRRLKITEAELVNAWIILRGHYTEALVPILRVAHLEAGLDFEDFCEYYLDCPPFAPTYGELADLPYRQYVDDTIPLHPSAEPERNEYWARRAIITYKMLVSALDREESCPHYVYGVRGSLVRAVCQAFNSLLMSEKREFLYQSTVIPFIQYYVNIWLEKVTPMLKDPDLVPDMEELTLQDRLEAASQRERPDLGLLWTSPPPDTAQPSVENPAFVEKSKVYIYSTAQEALEIIYPTADSEKVDGGKESARSISQALSRPPNSQTPSRKHVKAREPLAVYRADVDDIYDWKSPVRSPAASDGLEVSANSEFVLPQIPENLTKLTLPQFRVERKSAQAPALRSVREEEPPVRKTPPPMPGPKSQSPKSHPPPCEQTPPRGRMDRGPGPSDEPPTDTTPPPSSPSQGAPAIRVSGGKPKRQQRPCTVNTQKPEAPPSNARPRTNVISSLAVEFNDKVVKLMISYARKQIDQSTYETARRELPYFQDKRFPHPPRGLRIEKAHDDDQPLEWLAQRKIYEESMYSLPWGDHNSTEQNLDARSACLLFAEATASVMALYMDPREWSGAQQAANSSVENALHVADTNPKCGAEQLANIFREFTTEVWNARASDMPSNLVTPRSDKGCPSTGNLPSSGGPGRCSVATSCNLDSVLPVRQDTLDSTLSMNSCQVLDERSKTQHVEVDPRDLIVPPHHELMKSRTEGATRRPIDMLAEAVQARFPEEPRFNPNASAQASAGSEGSAKQLPLSKRRSLQGGENELAEPPGSYTTPASVTLGKRVEALQTSCRLPQLNSAIKRPDDRPNIKDSHFQSRTGTSRNGNNEVIAPTDTELQKLPSGPTPKRAGSLRDYFPRPVPRLPEPRPPRVPALASIINLLPAKSDGSPRTMPADLRRTEDNSTLETAEASGSRTSLAESSEKQRLGGLSSLRSAFARIGTGESVSKAQTGPSRGTQGGETGTKNRRDLGEESKKEKAASFAVAAGAARDHLKPVGSSRAARGDKPNEESSTSGAPHDQKTNLRRSETEDVGLVWLEKGKDDQKEEPKGGQSCPSRPRRSSVQELAARFESNAAKQVSVKKEPSTKTASYRHSDKPSSVRNGNSERRSDHSESPKADDNTGVPIVTMDKGPRRRPSKRKRSQLRKKASMALETGDGGGGTAEKGDPLGGGSDGDPPSSDSSSSSEPNDPGKPHPKDEERFPHKLVISATENILWTRDWNKPSAKNVRREIKGLINVRSATNRSISTVGDNEYVKLTAMTPMELKKRYQRPGFRRRNTSVGPELMNAHKLLLDSPGPAPISQVRRRRRHRGRSRRTRSISGAFSREALNAAMPKAQSGKAKSVLKAERKLQELLKTLGTTDPPAGDVSVDQRHSRAMETPSERQFAVISGGSREGPTGLKRRLDGAEQSPAKRLTGPGRTVSPLIEGSYTQSTSDGMLKTLPTTALPILNLESNIHNDPNYQRFQSLMRDANVVDGSNRSDVFQADRSFFPSDSGSDTLSVRARNNLLASKLVSGSPSTVSNRRVVAMGLSSSSTGEAPRDLPLRRDGSATPMTNPRDVSGSLPHQARPVETSSITRNSTKRRALPDNGPDGSGSSKIRRVSREIVESQIPPGVSKFADTSALAETKAVEAGGGTAGLEFVKAQKEELKELLAERGNQSGVAKSEATHSQSSGRQMQSADADKTLSVQEVKSLDRETAPDNVVDIADLPPAKRTDASLLIKHEWKRPTVDPNKIRELLKDRPKGQPKIETWAQRKLELARALEPLGHDTSGRTTSIWADMSSSGASSAQTTERNAPEKPTHPQTTLNSIQETATPKHMAAALETSFHTPMTLMNTLRRGGPTSINHRRISIEDFNTPALRADDPRLGPKFPNQTNHVGTVGRGRGRGGPPRHDGKSGLRKTGSFEDVCRRPNEDRSQIHSIEAPVLIPGRSDSQDWRARRTSQTSSDHSVEGGIRGEQNSKPSSVKPPQSKTTKFVPPAEPQPQPRDPPARGKAGRPIPPLNPSAGANGTARNPMRSGSGVWHGGNEQRVQPEQPPPHYPAEHNRRRSSGSRSRRRSGHSGGRRGPSHTQPAHLIQASPPDNRSRSRENIEYPHSHPKQSPNQTGNGDWQNNQRQYSNGGRDRSGDLRDDMSHRSRGSSNGQGRRRSSGGSSNGRSRRRSSQGSNHPSGSDRGSRPPQGRRPQDNTTKRSEIPPSHYRNQTHEEGHFRAPVGITYRRRGSRDSSNGSERDTGVPRPVRGNAPARPPPAPQSHARTNSRGPRGPNLGQSQPSSMHDGRTYIPMHRTMSNISGRNGRDDTGKHSNITVASAFTTIEHPEASPFASVKKHEYLPDEEAVFDSIWPMLLDTAKEYCSKNPPRIPNAARASLGKRATLPGCNTRMLPSEQMMAHLEKKYGRKGKVLAKGTLVAARHKFFEDPAFRDRVLRYNRFETDTLSSPESETNNAPLPRTETGTDVPEDSWSPRISIESAVEATAGEDTQPQTSPDKESEKKALRNEIIHMMVQIEWSPIRLRPTDPEYISYMQARQAAMRANIRADPDGSVRDTEPPQLNENQQVIRTTLERPTELATSNPRESGTAENGRLEAEPVRVSESCRGHSESIDYAELNRLLDEALADEVEDQRSTFYSADDGLSVRPAEPEPVLEPVRPSAGFVGIVDTDRDPVQSFMEEVAASLLGARTAEKSKKDIPYIDSRAPTRPSTPIHRPPPGEGRITNGTERVNAPVSEASDPPAPTQVRGDRGPDENQRQSATPLRSEDHEEQTMRNSAQVQPAPDGPESGEANTVLEGGLGRLRPCGVVSDVLRQAGGLSRPRVSEFAWAAVPPPNSWRNGSEDNNALPNLPDPFSERPQSPMVSDGDSRIHSTDEILSENVVESSLPEEGIVPSQHRPAPRPTGPLGAWQARVGIQHQIGILDASAGLAEILGNGAAQTNEPAGESRRHYPSRQESSPYVPNSADLVTPVPIRPIRHYREDFEGFNVRRPQAVDAYGRWWPPARGRERAHGHALNRWNDGSMRHYRTNQPPLREVWALQRADTGLMGTLRLTWQGLRRSLEQSENRGLSRIFESCLDVRNVEAQPCLEVRNVEAQPCPDVRIFRTPPCLEVRNIEAQPSLAVRNIEAQPPLNVRNIEAQPSLNVRNIEAQPSLNVRNVEAQPSLNVRNIEAQPSLNVRNVEAQPSLNVRNIEAQPSLNVRNVESQPSLNVRNVETEPLPVAPTAEQTYYMNLMKYARNIPQDQVDRILGNIPMAYSMSPQRFRPPACLRPRPRPSTFICWLDWLTTFLPPISSPRVPVITAVPRPTPHLSEYKFHISQPYPARAPWMWNPVESSPWPRVMSNVAERKSPTDRTSPVSSPPALLDCINEEPQVIVPDEQALNDSREGPNLDESITSNHAPGADSLHVVHKENRLGLTEAQARRLPVPKSVPLSDSQTDQSKFNLRAVADTPRQPCEVPKVAPIESQSISEYQSDKQNQHNTDSRQRGNSQLDYSVAVPPSPQVDASNLSEKQSAPVNSVLPPEHLPVPPQAHQFQEPLDFEAELDSLFALLTAPQVEPPQTGQVGQVHSVTANALPSRANELEPQIAVAVNHPVGSTYITQRPVAPSDPRIALYETQPDPIEVVNPPSVVSHHGPLPPSTAPPHSGPTDDTSEAHLTVSRPHDGLRTSTGDVSVPFPRARDNTRLSSVPPEPRSCVGQANSTSDEEKKRSGPVARPQLPRLVSAGTKRVPTPNATVPNERPRTEFPHQPGRLPEQRNRPIVQSQPDGPRRQTLASELREYGPRCVATCALQVGESPVPHEIPPSIQQAVPTARQENESAEPKVFSEYNMPVKPSVSEREHIEVVCHQEIHKVRAPVEEEDRIRSSATRQEHYAGWGNQQPFPNGEAARKADVPERERPPDQRGETTTADSAGGVTAEERLRRDRFSDRTSNIDRSRPQRDNPLGPRANTLARLRQSMRNPAQRRVSRTTLRVTTSQKSNTRMDSPGVQMEPTGSDSLLTPEVSRPMAPPQLGIPPPITPPTPLSEAVGDNLLEARRPGDNLLEARRPSDHWSARGSGAEEFVPLRSARDAIEDPGLITHRPSRGRPGRAELSMAQDCIEDNELLTARLRQDTARDQSRTLVAEPSFVGQTGHPGNLQRDLHSMRYLLTGPNRNSEPPPPAPLPRLLQSRHLTRRSSGEPNPSAIAAIQPLPTQRLSSNPRRGSQSSDEMVRTNVETPITSEAERRSFRTGVTRDGPHIHHQTLEEVRSTAADIASDSQTTSAPFSGTNASLVPRTAPIIGQTTGGGQVDGTSSGPNDRRGLNGESLLRQRYGSLPVERVSGPVQSDGQRPRRSSDDAGRLASPKKDIFQWRRWARALFGSDEDSDQRGMISVQRSRIVPEPPRWIQRESGNDAWEPDRSDISPIRYPAVDPFDSTGE